MFFPVSGVETPLWLPPLVAFGISFFTSMAGVSGAFLLLPFQMSVLGFVTPAVSATNHVYNVVAVPSGVYRYLREGRLVWPLVCVVVAGTAPGVILGGWIRLAYLPDPVTFKVFVGCVLLCLGGRLSWDVFRAVSKSRTPAHETIEEKPSPPSEDWTVTVLEFNWRRLVYTFQGRRYPCGVPTIFSLSLVVGLVGGIYGVGGGALIAPFFVAIYGLPLHTVAGATLTGTLATSVVGVVFYWLAAPYYQTKGLAIAPDWLLGALFGLGGIAGMYLGARTQRFVPAVWLKGLLGALLLFLSLRYITAWMWTSA